MNIKFLANKRLENVITKKNPIAYQKVRKTKNRAEKAPNKIVQLSQSHMYTD